MSVTPHRPGDVLIVSDLDGTLLRPDESLSSRTVDAINGYVAAGGLFTYATARSFTSARHVTRGLRLDLPVITYAGAVIVTPEADAPSQVALLPSSAVARVIEVAHTDSNLQPIIFAMTEGRDRLCWIPDRSTHWVEGFLSKRRNDPRLCPLTHWDQLNPGSAFYISLISSRERLACLYEELRKAEPGCHVILTEDIYRAGEWWLEVTSALGTKAAAINEVRRQHGEKPLICIGDNQNDLPMFAIAELALAVANAAPAIQAAAHEVLLSNTEDGVAQWLEQSWFPSAE